MQQRQPRLGDILDDYCPRERRVTNHAVVAMVGIDVKQTRCTTCDAEHDFKHAKVPRQRKKSDSPAMLYAQVLAGGPKKVTHDPPATVAMAAAAIASSSLESVDDERDVEGGDSDDEQVRQEPSLLDDDILMASDHDEPLEPEEILRPQPAEEGPVHRRLIRAQLPRIEGQPPPARPAPEFTIRQPAGRVNRFRPRNPPRAGGGGQFQGPGNRSNQGNGSSGPMRSGSQGHGSQSNSSQGNGSSGRPPMVSRQAKRQGSGRKRFK